VGGPSRVPKRVDAVGLAHLIIGSLLDFPGIVMRAKTGDAVIYEMTERSGRVPARRKEMTRHVPTPQSLKPESEDSGGPLNRNHHQVSVFPSKSWTRGWLEQQKAANLDNNRLSFFKNYPISP
jgi:hypothetical protein